MKYMISESVFNKKPAPLKIILIALAGIAILVAAFFAWQYFVPKDDAAKNQATVKRVVAEVGAIYLLPEGEPSVVQIQDKGQLKDQLFYEKAENGDYILVYEKDKIAVIYRDTVKKIVNAGAITLGDQKPNN
jgi:hypothetical protein